MPSTYLKLDKPSSQNKGSLLKNAGAPYAPFQDDKEGMIELSSTPVDKKQVQVDVGKNGPERPKEYEQHEKKREHEMSCEDKYRVPFCGQRLHWSTVLVFILLVVSLVVANTRTETTSPLVVWILSLMSALCGNIFLWDIGWVRSNAHYSMTIHNACDDIEAENLEMKESIKTLVSNCAQQMDMTHKACKQTSAMATEVGLVSETGKGLNDNVQAMADMLDSPAFKGYTFRTKRAKKSIDEAGDSNDPYNYYSDVIRTFKTSTKGFDNATLDFKQKKVVSRLRKSFSKYNAKCESCNSLPIDLDQMVASDQDGDHRISLWELCEGIYQNILRRPIGVESEKIEAVEQENERMKRHLNDVNELLADLSSGRVKPGEKQIKGYESTPVYI